MVRAVRLQAMRDAPDAFGSTYARELSRTPDDWARWVSSGATFLLLGQERAEGIVAGLPDAADSAIVQLMSMWVAPSRRRSGAAGALVAALLAWARGEGARAVRLLVIDTNVAARRCYERYGFRLTGARLVRERDGAIELEMEHRLGTEGESGGTFDR